MIDLIEKGVWIEHFESKPITDSRIDGLGFYNVYGRIRYKPRNGMTKMAENTDV